MELWQARCVQAYIAIHLHTKIKTADLARVAHSVDLVSNAPSEPVLAAFLGSMSSVCERRGLKT
jgi:hypothetical protein